MKKGKKKFWTLNEKVIALVLFLGVSLLATVYAVQTRLDKRNAEEMLEQTLAFMKMQCIRYDNFQASDETKSLMHLIDKTKEFSRCLGKLDEASTESLKNYAEEQKLAGLIILDENQKVVCEYNSDGGGYAAWETVIQDDNIQDILQYPQKVYAARSGENDEYDYAVVSREDEPGIILAYTYQPPVLLDENQIAIENLLTGYKMDMDGTVLITDGKKVLSSNDTTLRGQDVSFCVFIHGERSQVSEKLITVKAYDRLYYGGEAMTKGYHLYVFYPSSQVFTKRTNAMLYMLLIYIMFWLAILFIRHKSTQKYMSELNKRYDMELEYQKKLEQAIKEAEHANMAKTDFLRRMSHDIRTPINGIRGMIEIGNHFPDDIEKQQECREKIWEASGFLLDLVNDVLDMNKLESGNIQLEEVSFHLSDVLHEVSMLIEIQAKEHGLTFRTVQESGTHWDLIGSPLHVRQLFMNVLSNAVKYNKKNGSVSISYREISSDEETAVFEFVCADTGIGMGEEFQKRIFEPFAQENEAARTSYSGTGLGLSIVKALVERMNGSIKFDSEKGEGTTFYITLPFQIDKNAPVKEKEPEKTSEDTSMLEEVRILLVEDNELNMEIAEFMLEDEGAIVTQAWNGREAVEIFEKSAPGTYPVILMDLMMPEMDGLEAARTIRNMQKEDAASVVIIAMTANSFNDDVENCRKAGMNEHLSKPLDFGKLAETIKKYINSK